MLRTIEQRLPPDSIHEFRQAAELRFREGNTLYNKTMRAGAIYLWGYSTEMTLKAAFFSRVGYSTGQTILPTDMRTALVRTGNQLGLARVQQASLHDISRWADLLVAFRSAYGPAYPTPGFAGLVTGHARAVHHSWREFLRYHKYRTFPGEADRIRVSAGWFLENSSQL